MITLKINVCELQIRKQLIYSFAGKKKGRDNQFYCDLFIKYLFSPNDYPPAKKNIFSHTPSFAQRNLWDIQFLHR